MDHTKPILFKIIAVLGVLSIVFLWVLGTYDESARNASQQEYEKEWSIKDAASEAAYQTAMAYRANLEIKMTEAVGVAKAAIVSGTIKNLGGKTVTHLDLIVYMVDAEGHRIGETNAIIVLNPYLKPHYVENFACIFDFVPPGIAGHDFEITRIKLADD